ncbi:MAG: hypothetical protein H6807_10730 [Planctomycetes bacterium]|nr:hypothetical protein [Planctomycetota bacterium]
MSDHHRLFRRYLEIDAASEELVRRAAPALIRELDGVVSNFYQHIRRHKEAMARFPGGEAQLARQEIFLRDWLRSLLDHGTQGDNASRQLQVGRVHLDAAINEELMVAGMNWLRGDLVALCHRVELPEDIDRHELAVNLSRLIDFNLALMLTSYWRSFQERAMRLDRLAMIGQFTSTINHELRNPLGVIGTSSFLLRQRLEASGADAQSFAHLDKIARSIDRANSIISGLLRLLRIEQPDRAKIGLRIFLDDLHADLPAEEGLVLELRLPEPAAFGMFDPVQIGQVIHNLVRNAREAMDGKGRILISASSDPTAAEFLVQDDGPGIPIEQRERIFDPLFTTKSFGTGLGLTLAKSIVDSHGGSLRLEDGLDGRGIGFRIRLPHYYGPVRD